MEVQELLAWVRGLRYLLRPEIPSEARDLLRARAGKCALCWQQFDLTFS